MRKYFIFISSIILALSGAGFLLLAQGGQESASYPDAREYAPNFWFDSEEKYYPTDPLDFYYDESGNELPGKTAVAEYDKLSLDEKLDTAKIFYKVDDTGNEFVYQYWLFYVMNNYENGHYGDWESVFVFVDKESRNINKVVGSAHGSGNKLNNPENKSVWVYIGNGSHASCPVEIRGRACDSNIWEAREGWDSNGRTLDSSDLKIISLDQSYIDRFGDGASFDKQKSPTIGVNPYKVFGLDKTDIPFVNIVDTKKEKYLNPPLVGNYFGKTPTFAWEKEEYKNPEKILESTPTKIAKKVGGFFEGVGSAIAGVGKTITLPASKFLIASVTRKDDPTQADPVALGEVSASIPQDTNIINQNVSTRSPPPNVREGPALPAGRAGEESYSERSVPPLRPSGSAGQDAPNPVQLEASEAGPLEPVVGSSDPTTAPSDDGAETEFAFVKKVIDGDTVELASGQRVRYVGIDTPEDLLECYAEQAKQRNKSLVEEKRIILLKAPNHNDKDKYDRLLRFVWLDYYQDGVIDSADTFVNLDLVERGYARVNNFGETHEYEHRFESAEAEAERLELGLWGKACNEQLETIKEISRDIVQTAEKIAEDLGGEIPTLRQAQGELTSTLRPFEIAPNVFMFPPSSSGGSAPTPAPTPTPIPTPAPEPEATTTTRIVINEIQAGDAEFVELYNQFSSAKSLAGYYFSYYSSSKTAWNDPWRNQKFPDAAAIPANSYFLIGLKDYLSSAGNPNADWQPYTSAQISNTAGTIAIFPFDPSATTSEAAYAGRIDAVGWGAGLTLYEQSPASAPDSGKSITRDSSHSDGDNNSSDFSQSASSTPINSSGTGYDSNFSYTPLWGMYQKDAKHSGLATLAGPAWTSSSQATSSWTFQMTNGSGANTGGRAQAVIDYAGNIYATDSYGIVHKIISSGVEQWAFNPDDQSGVGQGFAGSSPALSFDSSRIYSVYTDNTERKLWIFSIKTSDGSLDWKYASSEDGHGQDLSSPILDSSGAVYYASRQSIYSVSSSGILNWETNLSPSRLGLVIPAIDSGYIYVSGKVSNNAGDRYIWKLNTSDGSEVWKKNPTGNNALANGVSINAEGTIYTGGYLNMGKSGLFAISATDGSKLWSNNIGDSPSTNLPNFDTNGNIYLGIITTQNSGLFQKVLASAIGAAQWIFGPEEPSIAQYPAVIDSQNRVYTGAKNKYIYALKTEDGTEIWKYQLYGEPVGFAVGKDVVYAVSYDGKVHALK